MTSAELTAPVVATTTRPSHPIRLLLRQPLSVIALVVILAVVALVAAAPWIAPYAPLEQDLLASLQGPTAAHPLGTDSLGRDVLSRLLYGGQPALIGVAIAALVFTVVGVSLGLLAGYLGGTTDRVIGAVADTLLAIPGIVVVLGVLAIFSQSVTASMITFGILSAGGLIRVVRGVVLSTREELYVSAARVSGAGPIAVMLRHVLPSLYAPVIVQLSLFAGICLAVQTGLGFLGVSTPPPAPDWGGMVGDASVTLAQAPSYLLVTGGVIFVMTLSFALLGDGLRDVFGLGDTASSRILSPRVSRSRPDAAERTSATDAPLVAVRDLTVDVVRGDDRKRVLHGVSFEVRAGEIVGLVGESGSGKTVTALTLMRLLDPAFDISGGAVELDGVDLLDLDDAGMRAVRGKRIGLVSQEPMVALDPLFTIGAQLREVLRGHHGGSRRELRDRALRLLADVSLPDPAAVLAKRPYELSGGMIQRVVIAMALAGDPDLLIADEPTTALDVTVQAGVLELLRDLRTSRGMSIVFVTHDLGVVADVCDRAIVMSEGRIVEQAAVEDLFYDPQADYTKRLISNTPSLLEEQL